MTLTKPKKKRFKGKKTGDLNAKSNSNLKSSPLSRKFTRKNTITPKKEVSNDRSRSSSPLRRSSTISPVKRQNTLLSKSGGSQSTIGTKAQNIKTAAVNPQIKRTKTLKSKPVIEVKEEKGDE